MSNQNSKKMINDAVDPSSIQPAISQQLTSDRNGHTLHQAQVFPNQGSVLVFDNRNEDTTLGQSSFIGLLNIHTKEQKILYKVIDAQPYGPGVGAASFHPNGLEVIFIHGLKNANEALPYAMTRRSGVGVDLSHPQQSYHMDARCVIPPFVPGALRGGSHAHTWSPSGKIISFTYNDQVLEQQASKDTHADMDVRVVGLMFSKEVVVPQADQLESFSGNKYAVIVSEVHTPPIWGSDQIEKAFDECWMGSDRKLVFQGHIRDEQGRVKTELFLVELPENLDLLIENDVKMDPTKRLQIPKLIHQKRISFTPNGLSAKRHWLRTSPNGDTVYFLMEDYSGITQIYGLEVNSRKYTPLTTSINEVQSQFNLNREGKEMVFFRNNCLCTMNLETLIVTEIGSVPKWYGIPHFSPKGDLLIFNAYDSEGYLQIYSHII